jgi:hypothetical protein
LKAQLLLLRALLVLRLLVLRVLVLRVLRALLLLLLLLLLLVLLLVLRVLRALLLLLLLLLLRVLLLLLFNATSLIRSRHPPPLRSLNSGSTNHRSSSASLDTTRILATQPCASFPLPPSSALSRRGS